MVLDQKFLVGFHDPTRDWPAHLRNLLTCLFWLHFYSIKSCLLHCMRMCTDINNQCI
uniref:Uncharacterized protein n=1 Tax=Rhizophora mucronata TaxID=61149 RepID=A0A2P2PWA1_RHIMU